MTSLLIIGCLIVGVVSVGLVAIFVGLHLRYIDRVIERARKAKGEHHG